MDRKEMLNQLAEEQLLPLYTVTDMSYLDKVEEVLLNNGLNFIEVTYRSDLASEAIKYFSESGKLIVGAGTVTNVEQAKEAVENGAQFIVMPGVSISVLEYCKEINLPVFPGTVTPTDIVKVLEYDIDTVKFFPANIYGGLEAIKALSGPFNNVRFVPTGGVNKDNVVEFLANDSILAVGGSFIISEEVIMKDNGETANKELADIVNKIK
ncbi:4-hydroxy-2-oxoglutarate aldolase [Suicoccus acidiformans]|uniref:4-hydroxy-2-oxoglutarate aldolase n=1 Tax=Suicoccus acidiformans TaxID=2036206 RepID=A0A347WIH4_9LACT|nr:bifunctional 4-hydroxy-2-oxoglutarate aldolase/2-dehydro-3-deoxy-phosphogluconate aldolase [Suicoccus acidiformans]AXY24881.1 4-hydroxy-2-oxoglutarate aldolase [Suicoccus acidiformans]